MRSNVAVYLALVSRCTLQVPNDLVTKAPASEYRFYRCLDMVARLGAAMRTEKTSTLQNRLHQSLDRPRQMARQFGLRFPEHIRPDSGHVRALRPASTDQKMLSAARKMDGRSVLVDGVVYTVCILDRNGSSPGCSNSYDPTRWSGSLRSRVCSCRSTLERTRGKSEMTTTSSQGLELCRIRRLVKLVCACCETASARRPEPLDRNASANNTTWNDVPCHIGLPQSA